MKERAEKHQHVPERYWFLIEVTGFSFTVVNSYSGACADALAAMSAAAAAERMNLMFMI